MYEWSEARIGSFQVMDPDAPVVLAGRTVGVLGPVEVTLSYEMARSWWEALVDAFWPRRTWRPRTALGTGVVPAPEGTEGWWVLFTPGTRLVCGKRIPGRPPWGCTRELGHAEPCGSPREQSTAIRPSDRA